MAITTIIILWEEAICSTPMGTTTKETIVKCFCKRINLEEVI